MKNTLETRLGIFVALAVIAAVLIMEVVGGVERFQRGYRLKALFTTVQDLKVGDRVRMAGVEVGRVEKIELEGTQNKVLVVMKVKRDAFVRTDSTNTIRFTGLMGQNYVNIDFGNPGSPRATDGSYLPTAEQPDLAAMMSKLDEVAENVKNVTRSFTGEKIDNILGPFRDFMTANQVPLTMSIKNLEEISTQIKDGKGTIGKLIKEDTLYNSALATVTNLQDVGNEVKATVADARGIITRVQTTVDQVNSGHGTVGKLLHDEALYQETTASMTNLREILEKINHGQGSVGKLVNDQEFYRNAKLSLQKLDKATEGLEDQGPLSVMGLIVNNLF